MLNKIETLPSEIYDDLPPVKTATWQYSEGKYATYAPNYDSIEFMDSFPDHTRIYSMLGTSGSSWQSQAYLFCQVDCFDPPQYIQFGSSFEDCYESFCDNEESLIIDESDLKDYDLENHGSYNSSGQPIDTDNVHGSGLLRLVSVTFA